MEMSAEICTVQLRKCVEKKELRLQVSVSFAKTELLCFSSKTGL